jgi:hypothetical protein
MSIVFALKAWAACFKAAAAPFIHLKEDLFKEKQRCFSVLSHGSSFCTALKSFCPVMGFLRALWAPTGVCGARFFKRLIPPWLTPT